MKSLSGVPHFATPWTAAYQAPPPRGFSRQEYWSGVPLHSLQHHFTTLQILLSSFIIYETGTRREFIMAEEAERHLSIFPLLFLLRFCFRLLYFNFPLFWKSYQMSTNDWINMLIYFPNIHEVIGSDSKAILIQILWMGNRITALPEISLSLNTLQDFQTSCLFFQTVKISYSLTQPGAVRRF